MACCCFSGSEASRQYTRMLVSTKTLALMQFLAGGILGLPAFQLSGRLGQVLLHGRLIRLFLRHFFPEEFPHEAGKAGIPLRRPDPGPSGHFFIQSNSDILHNTIIVLHVNSVNFFEDI